MYILIDADSKKELARVKDLVEWSRSNPEYKRVANNANIYYVRKVV